MALQTAFLTELLTSEQQLAEQLHGQLQQQLAAIKHNRLSEFESLRQQSAALLIELQTQAQQRIAWLEQHNLPTNADSLTHPALQPLAPLWQSTQQHYQKNQALANILNEVVLHARLRIQQRLKILLGKQNEPYLYDQKGGANHLQSSYGYTQA